MMHHKTELQRGRCSDFPSFFVLLMFSSMEQNTYHRINGLLWKFHGNLIGKDSIYQLVSLLLLLFLAVFYLPLWWIVIYGGLCSSLEFFWRWLYSILLMYLLEFSTLIIILWRMYIFFLVNNYFENNNKAWNV